MSNQEKRVVHPALLKLLQIDIYITNKFWYSINKIIPLNNYSTIMVWLEYSCHAIVWFFLSLTSLYILWSESLAVVQIEFLLGLIIDILCVMLLKAFIRRRRPPESKEQKDIRLSVKLDEYSFPSGHASRATFIMFFFIHYCNRFPILWFTSIIWSPAVIVSRVLMRRHHILDIVAGFWLGYLNMNFIKLINISTPFALSVMSMLGAEISPEADEILVD